MVCKNLVTRFQKGRALLSPRTVKFFMGGSTAATAPMVDTEDNDDLSSSSSSRPMAPLMRLVAVELCLFFLGIGGRIFPGNSVRSAL